MHVMTSYPDGIFSWVDLSTSDPEAAKRFYSGLFGWQTVDLPTNMGTVYTLLQIQGKNVAGLGPSMEGEGTPPYWASYVNHRDVDAVAARAATAGGQLLFPPMDVMDSGRMAIIQDPTGAIFGVWQPRNHIGAQLVNMPNTLVWNELQTRDVTAAAAFYKAVFGWDHDVDSNDYYMCKLGDRVHAGMLQINESWGPVTPNWAVYFMVEDVAAATGKAQELGGTALVGPQRAGELGTFTVVRDPQGAVFTIMQFDGPVDSPPGA